MRHESELASNYFSMWPLQVTEMKKEKTALVIPNAVQVKIVDLEQLKSTAETTTHLSVTNSKPQVCAGTDKFFFTSFAARDKTYVMLFR